MGISSVFFKKRTILNDFAFCRRSLLLDLKRVRRLYVHLWRATVVLGSAFSLILLIDLAMIFVVTIMFPYLIVAGFSTSKPSLKELRWSMVTRLVMNWAMLFFILIASEKPVQQVRMDCIQSKPADDSPVLLRLRN